LSDIFKQHKGILPSKETVQEIAQKSGLLHNQIYKWFWDMSKKKVKV
jgi:hypothetical protein